MSGNEFLPANEPLFLKRNTVMPIKFMREHWDRLSTGFGFGSIRTYRLGNREHHTAEFVGDGSSFLNAGGDVEIGYDANRPWEPTPRADAVLRKSPPKAIPAALVSV
jgi:hypothetical protein